MVSRAEWSPQKKAVVWTIVGVVVVLAALVAWIGVRGLIARSELLKAAPLTASIEKAVANGNTATARELSAQLTKHTNTAAAMTSDPIWRGAEILPVVGANFTAVRQAAAATDLVATRVVAPLTSVAGVLNSSAFKPVNGVVNLKALDAIEPTVSKAQTSMDRAAADVKNISSSNTIGPVTGAVAALSAEVVKASRLVDSLGNAVTLIPRMLGDSGPRNYLLLIENPAEMRATGGISGAMAVIHTDSGAITLAQQASSADFRRFRPPIATLPAETQGLYGLLPAQYIQDVNLTPHFPLSAQLASQMWAKRMGSSVDGVITIDPIALGYILDATGPIKLPDGITLTSQNAVKVFLSDVYRIYPDNASQDAFFAAAAAEIFHRVAGGDANSVALLGALSKAGSERRIDLWSAHPEDQSVLAGTTIAGELPVSTPVTAEVGVYLNDATAAKMDYYLHVETSVSSRICRSDNHPNARVTVTLKNEAPADAATSLPAYVTGADDAGVPAGSILTKVQVYGPEGSLLVSTTSNGADFAHLAATDTDRAVSQFSIQLAPGESKTVTVNLLDLQQIADATNLTVTPGIHTLVVPAVAPACTKS